ncbi:carboxypeptidase regulatory-like domain-containing protein, partial [bacterium]|nr:carboxypeptidase regulatory-like domain-containing protein [bacterium]
YTVSHTLSSKNVIFQPLFAYLPEKSGTQSYAITVTVYLDDGCVASAQVTAELTGGSAQALVPQLISPSDDAVDSVPITTFVWDIADPSGILTGQIFTLNGVNLFNLGTQATETDDYTLSVQEITGGDLGKTYRFKLTLKKTSYTVGGQKVGILTNNGNDSNDWNRWQVTAQARQTGSEAPALASPVWRFRYIAGILGTYHWCTGTASCQSGSLRECLATGRACYLSDEATCRANAPQDCGPNPPLRTYHWCTTGESCSQGTLKECSVTGKNCYMQENDVGGNGCLQNATFECSNEPEYVWCVTAHDCSRPGSLEECNAAGKTCFRLSASQRSCPVEAFDDCAVTTGVLADNPLGKIPEFMPSFLDQLGLSDEALIGLEALSTQAFPVVSLILLLPLGVLIIFFPRPRGRVFDSKTRHGVAGAVVTVLREGKFVNAAVSGRRGYYHGFKLAPGEYQIIVSTPRFIFPSFTERRRSTPMRNFYLGETFKVSSEFAPTVTFQVPVDLDPQVPLTDEQKRERERKHTGRRLWQALVALVNWMSGLWTLSFLIVIVFTLIYPIWLNIIILGIYVVGLVRRLMASLHHANITGRVVDANGQKVDGLALTCHTLAYHRLVGETRTDSNGRFEFFGNPHDKYQLSVAPFEFVEKTGRTATYLVDFGDDRAQELTLVVAEATDA